MSSVKDWVLLQTLQCCALLCTVRYYMCLHNCIDYSRLLWFCYIYWLRMYICEIICVCMRVCVHMPVCLKLCRNCCENIGIPSRRFYLGLCDWRLLCKSWYCAYTTLRHLGRVVAKQWCLGVVMSATNRRSSIESFMPNCTRRACVLYSLSFGGTYSCVCVRCWYRFISCCGALPLMRLASAYGKLLADICRWTIPDVV